MPGTHRAHLRLLLANGRFAPTHHVRNMDGNVRDAKLRQANWARASSPKPAGDAQAVAASDQHRVFAPLRQETDQSPRDGLDIARSLAVEDPQLAACIRSPRVIEVQHER